MTQTRVLVPRIGLGFDVHRLVQGRTLILGGVRVPHELGLEGHSDGDALIHAVTDALLGAAGAGDIGSLFPSEDPRWSGAESRIFLSRAIEVVADRGYRAVQLDSVVMAERPRLAPHIADMRTNLASLLSLDESEVSIKATTCDRLGFVGRGEGIAAQAVVSVLPHKPT